MSDLRTAAQQALEALELAQTDVHWELNSPMRKFLRKAEKSLHAALAPPEHELEWDEVFDAAVYSWKTRTPGRDALRLCFQDKSDDSEIFTHWTSRELMDFAVRIATLYTAPRQRQPLTDDQIDAIIRSNVTITDQNLSGAVYMSMRELEVAHGIEEQP